MHRRSLSFVGRLSLLSAILMLLSACVGSQATSTPVSRSVGAPAQSAPPLPPPRPAGSCHVRGVNGNLPDPTCTPGKANPQITQANIKDTICNTARNPDGSLVWHTGLIRPDQKYTTDLKKQQIGEYGFTSTNLADYEEDHLVALTDGGDPTSPDNLWPEPKTPAPGYPQKDKVEVYVNHLICSGAMTLDDARAQLAKDWTVFYTQMQTKGLEPPDSHPNATPVD